MSRRGWASDSFEARTSPAHLQMRMPPYSEISSEILVSQREERGQVRPVLSDLADLAALYEAHADALRRAIVRLGGPGADAEDLLHDVFLIAMRRLGSFEGRSAPATWLYGIAIKVVAAARRKAKVRRLFGFAQSDAAVDWN